MVLMSLLRWPRRKAQLSQHSALMGGQFPSKKRSGTFKNPLFFDGFGHAKRPKIELSLLMPQKTTFLHVFRCLIVISRPDRVVWIK